MRPIWVLALIVATSSAGGAGAPADGPVVEIVTAFSPTFVPLPADQDFTGNGLITQSFEKNNGPVEYAVHLNVRGAYDDNIALTRTNRLDDKYIQIQPSLMLGISFRFDGLLLRLARRASLALRFQLCQAGLVFCPSRSQCLADCVRGLCIRPRGFRLEEIARRSVMSMDLWTGYRATCDFAASHGLQDSIPHGYVAESALRKSGGERWSSTASA